MKVEPIIMSGGAGTRLWPVSRQNQPKQFLPLLGSNSLLQQTCKRVSDHTIFSGIKLIGNKQHVELMKNQLADISTKFSQIIAEPKGKNTAAAIAIIALLATDPEQVQLILPADHHIEDEQAFLTAVELGKKAAQLGQIVTFGIIPHAPETGYGYIYADCPAQLTGTYKIDHFKEKPNLETAKQWCQDKHYSWNSGMFMFQPRIMIEELKTYCPELLQACQETLQNSEMSPELITLSQESFIKVPSLPIDIAVMERTKKAVVIPISIGWSDIGSWSALYEMGIKDENNNVAKGDVMILNGKENFVYSDKRLVIVSGVNNLMVVETEDTIMIMPREEVQSVKEIVEKLKQQSRPEVSS